MQECGFLRTRILLYKERIVDSVLIRENTGQWKPVFSHVLCSDGLQQIYLFSYLVYNSGPDKMSYSWVFAYWLRAKLVHFRDLTFTPRIQSIVSTGFLLPPLIYHSVFVPVIMSVIFKGFLKIRKANERYY